MDKIIITVVGQDTIGIIAKVCTYLSDNQINILDITQTIVGGYFNMMVIADMEKCGKEFGVVSDELKELGNEIGLRILAQKEEIFTKMHRL
ncbi:MAG: ACT domain-containing protein [Eubacteriales bacterium]|nr:ACT domain-containing protein [Eubacteriales bacterium]